MIKYFIRRLLIMIPTLIGILLIVYILTYSLPGTAQGTFPAYGDGDALDSVYEALGAGENIATRFIRYCYNVVVHGTLGPSTGLGRTIGDDIKMRAQRTLILCAIAFVFTVLIGVPAGICAATHKNKWQDHSVSFMTLAFSSVPSYFLALMLVIVFVLGLKLIKSVSFYSWESYILPAVVLCSGGIALASKMTRSCVIDILEKPYITALRAKGLRRKRVLYVHVLRNSLIPIVSSLGNIIIQLLCSTLIVENFFNINGLGPYLVSAVSSRNQYALLGGVLFTAVIIMLVSIVCDLCCILVNPQIKAQYGKKRAAANGK